jgi:hypothetical protein
MGNLKLYFSHSNLTRSNWGMQLQFARFYDTIIKMNKQTVERFISFQEFASEVGCRCFLECLSLVLLKNSYIYSLNSEMERENQFWGESRFFV